MKKNTFFYTLVALLGVTYGVSATSMENDNIDLAEAVLLNDIEFIEDDEIYDLGFDASLYLPFVFDPYKGMIFELSEINYIETPEEIDLGFDSQPYLPKNFNPYVGQ